jgi:hypothetical protein
MLSGFVAVFLRKGSRRHGLAGNVFVIAMLSLSLTGVLMAIVKSQVGNILGGSLTFYLVATAWMTGRNRERKTGSLDWGALLVVLGVGVVTVTYGFEAAMSPSGLKNGDPAGQYFFLGVVALLAATGDIRMLVRGGISGSRRIARHLWRMCFALFVAAASIFLARAHLFPAVLRKTGALWFLSLLPLMLMVFWMLRVRFTNAYKQTASTSNTSKPQTVERAIAA